MKKQEKMNEGKIINWIIYIILIIIIISLLFLYPEKPYPQKIENIRVVELLGFDNNTIFKDNTKVPLDINQYIYYIKCNEEECILDMFENKKLMMFKGIKNKEDNINYTKLILIKGDLE